MDFESLRRLYMQYGGAPGDAGERVAEEVAKESEERQQVIALAMAGFSMREIGDKLKVTHGSVRSRLLLTMKGIRKRIEMSAVKGGYITGDAENRHPDEFREAARALREGGMTITAIAKRLEVSKASVSRWCR